MKTRYHNSPLSPQTYHRRRYEPKDGRYAAACFITAAIALGILILLISES